MKTHFEERRKKIDSILSHNFMLCCMSNTKWVKLIESLVKNASLLPEIKLKLVWDENLRNLDIDYTTTKDFDYYSTAMESMISGYPTGWYAYKEIEWIEFQDNSYEISKILDNLGKFYYQVHGSKLKLFAYKTNT